MSDEHYPNGQNKQEELGGVAGEGDLDDDPEGYDGSLSPNEPDNLDGPVVTAPSSEQVEPSSEQVELSSEHDLSVEFERFKGASDRVVEFIIGRMRTEEGGGAHIVGYHDDCIRELEGVVGDEAARAALLEANEGGILKGLESKLRKIEQSISSSDPNSPSGRLSEKNKKKILDEINAIKGRYTEEGIRGQIEEHRREIYVVASRDAQKYIGDLASRPELVEMALDDSGEVVGLLDGYYESLAGQEAWGLCSDRMRALIDNFELLINDGSTMPDKAVESIDVRSGDLASFLNKYDRSLPGSIVAGIYEIANRRTPDYSGLSLRERGKAGVDHACDRVEGVLAILYKAFGYIEDERRKAKRTRERAEGIMGPYEYPGKDDPRVVYARSIGQ